ncbi:autotransporter outer membrane beta-barrel domain-containing protein [Escherichia coli]|uniref:autotransporter outer membrane beta-barrel domain-containing protein n=1 Tax=Escherichia coli TaxID=562 RepID=UPI000BE31BE4|nr:autotransporter outer membrane beta-barrel domain-containing protein [Escherichia coli]
MNRFSQIVWNESTGEVGSDLSTGQEGQQQVKIRQTVLAPLIASFLLTPSSVLAENYSNETLPNSTTAGSVLNEGDIATNTTINSGGHQYVYSGGSATDTLISGGDQHVSSGGSAINTIINGLHYKDGSQYVSSGGNAINTIINDKGKQYVYNGGNAISTTINSRGVQVVSNGGIATNTTINGGGQIVYSGGKVSVSRLNSGHQYVYSGGSATDIIIDRFGNQIVYSGGRVSNTTINGGYQSVHGGHAISTTINSGGQQSVLNSGSVTSTTINNGGTLMIASDSTGTDIVQNGGGAIITDTAATVSGSNTNGEFSVADGRASNMLLENGGSLTVDPGHSVKDTMVGSGGLLGVVQDILLLGNNTIADSGKIVSDEITLSITNNGHLHFLNNSAATYTFDLTGTGDLKVDGCNLMLSGTLSQDGGVSIVNSGTMVMDDLQATADLTMQAGTSLSLEQNSTLAGRIVGDGAGAGNVTVRSSLWELKGDSTVGELTMDNGTVHFHSPQSENWHPTTLTAGSLSGNGTFRMNTDIAAHTGDLLNVKGNASGNFVLNIRNTGQEPASADSPLRVVHTGSGDARFTLNGGKVDAGTWEYYLNKKNTDWYLKADVTDHVDPVVPVRHLTKSADAVLGMATAPVYIFNSELQNLRFRHGDVIGNTRLPGGVWGRYMGSDKRIRGAADAGYTLAQNGMETGGDKVFELGDSQLAVGAFVSYTDNSVSHNRGGNSKVGSTGGGLYATWFDNGGYYVDGVIKFNRFSNKLRTRMSDSVAVKGDYTQNGFGGSLEAGKTFTLNENAWVQAYVRTTTFRANAKNIRLDNGMAARIEATWSLQGEAGVNLGMNLDVNDVTVKPYLTAAVNHEFSDKNKVRINNSYDFTNDISGTTGKYGAGVNAQLTPNAGIWAEVGYQKGNKMESPVTGTVGFRINF